MMCLSAHVIVSAFGARDKMSIRVRFPTISPLSAFTDKTNLVDFGTLTQGHCRHMQHMHTLSAADWS